MDSKLSQLVDQKCDGASTHHVHYPESNQYCFKIISISKPTAYVGALPPVAQPSVILSLNIKKNPKVSATFAFVPLALIERVTLSNCPEITPGVEPTVVAALPLFSPHVLVNIPRLMSHPPHSSATLTLVRLASSYASRR